MLLKTTPKDKCWNKIVLCAQDQDTIVGSIANMNGMA